tara:strand:- start:1100 stop:1699 length:600 start_codon:yes stop_codon:yes gene_type:complete
MLRIVLMVMSAFLMAGCKDISQENSTELITDSYFFQKNVFNLNLYECVTAQSDFNSIYKKSFDMSDFLYLSELKDQDSEVENCNQIYSEINELTPIKENLLDGSLYLELSTCIANVPEDELYTSLNSYLEYIKNNDINLWSGVSKFNGESFIWVNIWPNQEYREIFMKDWLNSSQAGDFSQELSKSATCESPYTNLFLK